MVVAASGCGGVFQRQGLGDWSGCILNENLVQSAQDLRLSRRFTFQQDNNQKHTAKRQCRSGLGTTFWMSLSVPTWTQSNVSGETWKWLSTDGSHPSWQPERIYKIPKSRCAKLVASYPRTLGCNHCQRCFNEVPSKESEYLHMSMWHFSFFLLHKFVIY